MPVNLETPSEGVMVERKESELRVEAVAAHGAIHDN